MCQKKDMEFCTIIQCFARNYEFRIESFQINF